MFSERTPQETRYHRGTAHRRYHFLPKKCERRGMHCTKCLAVAGASADACGTSNAVCMHADSTFCFQSCSQWHTNSYIIRIRQAQELHKQSFLMTLPGTCPTCNFVLQHLGQQLRFAHAGHATNSSRRVMMLWTGYVVATAHRCMTERLLLASETSMPSKHQRDHLRIALRRVEPCKMRVSDNNCIGALIIRIGVWGPLYYDYKKEPPK